MKKQAKQNVNIMVLGLGYVGLPLALELARFFTVSGFDTNQERIKELNKGIDITKEILDTELKEWNFPLDYFKDKKVLDLGAFDGFYSFNAEESGAESVTALDGYVWLGKTTATKKGFDIAKQIKDSKVKEVIMDVEHINFNSKKLGKFDVILFAGVLTHIREPLSVLQKISSLLNPDGKLFIETTYNEEINDINKPVMLFHEKDSLNGDNSNYWTANKICLIKMLEECNLTIDKVYETSTKRTVIFCENKV